MSWQANRLAVSHSWLPLSTFIAVFYCERTDQLPIDPSQTLHLDDELSWRKKEMVDGRSLGMAHHCHSDGRLCSPAGLVGNAAYWLCWAIVLR